MIKTFSFLLVLLISSCFLSAQSSTRLLQQNNQQNEQLNSQSITNALNGGRSIDDLSFGSEYSFNSLQPKLTSSSTLDETHFVIAYKENNYPFENKLIAGEITGGNIVSFGSEVTFCYDGTNYFSVESLDATHFIIGFGDADNSSHGTIILGTVTGTSISLGSAYVYNAAYTQHISTSKLDDTHFFVFYTGAAVVGTLSGSTISFGPPYYFIPDDDDTPTQVTVKTLDATHVVIAYNASYSWQSTIIATISGTVISFGSSFVYSTGNSSFISIDTLSSNKFVIAFSRQINWENEDYFGNAIIGTVTGSSITFGLKYIFNDVETAYIGATSINDTNFIIAYKDEDGSNYGEAILCTASDSEISFGCRIAFNETHTAHISAITLDEDNFVISYMDNDSKGKSIVGDVIGVGVITWDGSSDTDWNTASNWDGDEVPTKCENVIIPNVTNQPVIAATDTASCKDLTIQSGASLTLKSNSSGTASLFNKELFHNNGIINIERYISADEWHYISSPISDGTAGIFLGEYLQYYDYDGNWNDIVDPATTLIPAKGYGLWGVSRANTYTFSGNLNNGQLSVPFYSVDSASDGWNLLGNPYPSSIDWSLLDSDYGALYYWNPGLSTFVSWNNGSGAGSQYVPAMQGFLISWGGVTDYVLYLHNFHRTHEGRTTYYKSEATASDFVELQVDGNGYYDQLFVHIDDQATEVFDFYYDAFKLFSPEEAVPQIYSYTSGDELSIDRRPQTDIIQLGFKCGKDGSYSIKINEISDLGTVLIEDTKTGFIHNLQNGSYQFDYNINDVAKRFKLHLQVTGLSNPTEETVNIYASNKTIYLESDESLRNGRLILTDITGRIILNQAIEDRSIIRLPFDISTGIYIVSIDNGKTILSKKVMIN